MEVIEVKGISKKYILGSVGTGSLKEDLKSIFYRSDKRKKEVVENQSEYWALKDVSFSVNQGDTVGIIGKNGAGKSTLLKILSRITAPTSGTIKVRGRIASLLEVGTGFHPELSGKDNIFLNGAILGMTKHEIRSKFDEIVSFSGIEKFIDTPVKRYSSGMYVRLAFAVAAHLEPEILIIDEVLAVGDAEFQKKCLGKMGEVASQGRTVLFVSHNMTAVNSLCNKGVYLKNGQIIKVGTSEHVVQTYLSSEQSAVLEKVWQHGYFPGDEISKLHWVRIVDINFNKIDVVNREAKVGIQYQFEITKGGFQPIPNIIVSTLKGETAFHASSSMDSIFAQPGIYRSTLWIPANFLKQDIYSIGIALSTMMPEIIHFYIPDALVFEVLEDLNKRKHDYKNHIPGVIRPEFEWDNKAIEI